jgi:hypothetical protein
MSDRDTAEVYHGPGGIGRWVWWYVVAMLIAMGLFAAFLAFQ